MSWNNIYKLKPQKPKPECKQSLVSTEFLVWDMQFAFNNQSNDCSATLLQNTSIYIYNTALSQLFGTPET